MVIRDGAAIRKERIDKLLQIIEKHQNEDGWTKERTIGIFCRQTGLKPLTAKEYAQEQIDFGLVIEENENWKMASSLK